MPLGDFSQEAEQLLRVALDMQAAGRFVEARERFIELLAITPEHPQVLAVLGALSLQLDEPAQAHSWLERCLTQAPDHAVARRYHILALDRLGDLDAARLSALAAVAQPSASVAAYLVLGDLQRRCGRLSEARDSYERCLGLEPENALALNYHGAMLLQLGQVTQAVLSLRRAIAVRPDYVEAHINLGAALQELGLLEEALAAYRAATALEPNHADAHNNLGSALQALKRPKEAIAAYDRAIALAPNHADALNNRGVSLQEIHCLHDAMASFDQALCLRPAFVQAYNNRGRALHELGRINEAIADYDRALELDPGYVRARFHKSLSLLLVGELAEGWRQYESRFEATACISEHKFAQPVYDGSQDLRGRTLFVHAEQGYGDTLQFCRYIPLLVERGATVLLNVPRELVGLLSSLPGRVSWPEPGMAVPHFDLHCPLLSLPRAFGTTLTTIPGAVPYLRVDPGLRDSWTKRLGQRRGPRVGIAWSGSPTHGNDRNRSIPLSLLCALSVGGLELHCLQKDMRAGDDDLLRAHAIGVHSQHLEDFSQTAALVDQMDLVVSVDTSIAHLAGALGKPLCVLLPFVPDFRWLLQRTDSPWYPSAELLRQSAPGHWDSPLRVLQERLTALAGSNLSRDPDHGA